MKQQMFSYTHTEEYYHTPTTTVKILKHQGLARKWRNWNSHRSRGKKYKLVQPLGQTTVNDEMTKPNDSESL